MRVMNGPWNEEWWTLQFYAAIVRHNTPSSAFQLQEWPEPEWRVFRIIEVIDRQWTKLRACFAVRHRICNDHIRRSVAHSRLAKNGQMIDRHCSLSIALVRCIQSFCESIKNGKTRECNRLRFELGHSKWSSSPLKHWSHCSRLGVEATRVPNCIMLVDDYHQGDFVLF